MVTVKSASRSDQATMLEIDTGDPEEQHFHVIPDGVLETRMEAWGLSRDDAIELLMAEAHGKVEVPDRFRTPDFAKAKAKVNSAIRANGVQWDVPRDQVSEMTRLDPDVEAAVRRHVRDEIQLALPASQGHLRSAMAIQAKADEAAVGYQRLAEERLADDIISANPELNLAPRVVGREPVGLTVKLIE